MTLYRVIVWLMRIFSRLYFIEIRCLQPDRVPDSGPVILAANHPASILDAILLAMQSSRRIHFLAQSGLFKNRWVGGLLRRLGAIPVYRAHETVNSGQRNIAVFDKVYALFERGGCLGLFPEGRNSPPGQVAELRTGGARMALGAEARNEYELGLTIVPVGINYEHRELFMSSALLRFGPPLRVADYAGLHRTDSAEAVKALTADLQASLRRQATHVEDKQIHELAQDLSEVLGHQLAPSEPAATDPDKTDSKSQSRIKRWVWKLLEWYRPDPGEFSYPFEARARNRKQLTDILTKAASTHPSGVAALRRQLDRYKDHLRQTELSRALKQSLETPVRERLIRLRMTFYALIMAPVALFGLVHNVVPYLLTKYTARLSRQEAIRAFTYFGVGFLAFMISYLALGFWLWHFAGMNWKWVLCYLALLPPAGFAALHYRRNILIYRDKILVRTFFWNQEELIRLLRRERQDIIRYFEELAAVFQTPEHTDPSAAGTKT